jgi:hypothetical protein
VLKEIYIYKLTDAQGNIRLVVKEDAGDRGCVSGLDRDGKWQCYDGDELWYAYDWATKHGMTLESGAMTIDVPDSIFNCEGKV